MKEVKSFFEKEWDKSDKVVWSLLTVAVGVIIGIMFAPRKGNLKIGSDNRNNGNDNHPEVNSKRKDKQKDKNEEKKCCKHSK